MDWQAHRLFGKIIAQKYDLPVEGFLEWTIMPDMSYYKGTYWKYVLLHRLTLHGVNNIDVVIDQGKHFPQYVKYEAQYDTYIRCLIMSHNYLDLFNFFILPSWPRNNRFRVVFRQVPQILRLRTLSSPDGLEAALKKMVDHHKNSWDLYNTMLIEYLSLPKIGWYTKQILTLYED